MTRKGKSCGSERRWETLPHNTQVGRPGWQTSLQQRPETRRRLSPSAIKSKCPENVPSTILGPKGTVEVNKSLTRVFSMKEERDRRQQTQIINTNLVLQSEERHHGARATRHSSDNYSLDLSFHFILF